MERLYSYNSKRPTYQDLTFRLIVSIPPAAYMVLYREDDSLWHSLLDISFWVGGAFSYLVCILLLWIIRKVTLHLDKTTDWRRKTFSRTLQQFCWGIAATLILTFFLATLYFLFFKMDIRDTDYIRTDLPLVASLIVLANVYYLSYFLWEVPPVGYVPIRLVEDVIKSQEQHSGPGENKTGNRLLFLAQTDEGIIPIIQENIAAVFRQNEYVILKTFDRRTITLNQSINQVSKELDGSHFFQINPRWIVNYKICLKFSTMNYGKRYLDLAPPIDQSEEVTRGRVKDFEAWMRR